MAAALDHDPFSTRILFEPLLNKPLLSDPSRDSYAAIDKAALSLNDKLDLAFKSDHDFDLPETPKLQLPELYEFDELPAFTPQGSSPGGVHPQDVWKLSQDDTALEKLASLRTWKLNIPDPRSNDSSRNTTRPATTDFRKTLGALDQYFRALRQCATQLAQESSTSPTRIALAACLHDLETGLEWLLSHPSSSGLDLSAENVKYLLAEVLQAVQGCAGQQDSEILARLSTASRSARHASPVTRAVLTLVLRRASGPVVETVLGHVGLRVSGARGEGSAAGRTEHVDADLAHAWNLLTDEEKGIVENTYNDLAQLRPLEPRHPLADPLLYGLWFKEQDALHGDDNSLQRYETRVEAALAGYYAGSTRSADYARDYPPRTSYHDSELLAWTDDARQQKLLSSLDRRLGQVPDSDPGPWTQTLRDALGASSDPGSIKPQPIGIADSILHAHLPLLRLQARQVHTALLRSLFTTCDITTHLETLHAKYLLADGIFLQRLSTVIFPDDFTSSHNDLTFDAHENNLYLPSGSSTRQALEDILSPANPPSPPAAKPEPKPEAPRPAMGLSTRDLPQAQLSDLLQRGMVHTLELLSLRYVPPQLVARVIPPETTARYDDVFRHLLRLRRVLLLAQRASRRVLARSRSRTRAGVDTTSPATADAGADTDAAARRFAAEAQFFAATLSAYAQGCIERAWASFRRKLSEMRDSVLGLGLGLGLGSQSQLRSGSGSGPGSRSARGLDELAALHRVVVDGICARLGVRPEGGMEMGPGTGDDDDDDDDNNDDDDNDDDDDNNDDDSLRAGGMAGRLDRGLSLVVRGCEVVLALELGGAEYALQVAALRETHRGLHRLIRGVVRSLLVSSGRDRREEGDVMDVDGVDADGGGGDGGGGDGDAGEEVAVAEMDAEKQSGLSRRTSPFGRLGEMLNYNDFYSDD